MDIHERLEQWTKVFCEYSYNNETYAQLAFHLVLGQVWKRRFIWKGAQRLDGRISIGIFWDSSGGKSAPYGFVKEALESAGKTVNDLDDYTDAALVGTWTEDPDAEDGEDNLILEEGIIQISDVIHFDEASTLFVETAHTKKAVTFLEKSLNPIGSAQSEIVKKLARGPPIQFFSDLSLYLTSYIPEGLGEEFMNKGLMQRVLILPKRLTYANRVENIRADADRLGKKTVVPEDYDEIMEWFSNLGQTEDARLIRDEKIDWIWDDVRDYIKNRNVRLLTLTQNLDSGVQSVANSMIARYVNFMYVMATHCASIELRTRITKEDVDYSYALVRDILEYVLPFLEMDAGIAKKGGKEERLAKELRKLHTRLLTQYADRPQSKDGWVLKSDLWSLAESELKTSSSTLYRATRECDWLTETTIKRKKYVRIV